MINVFFDDSPLSSGHAVRGIGSYTRNLKTSLEKMSDIKLVEDVSKSDIVHYPYFDLFFKTLNPIKGKKNVVTIFDVIPLIYPDKYPPGIKGTINFLRQKNELKKVDAVITISETSKKDIVRFLDVQPEKVHVTYLAATTEFKKLTKGKWANEIKEKYNLPDKFVLYVGDVNYNKNVNTLAKACKLANVDLVIVGKQAASLDFNRNHPENKSLNQLIEEFGTDPHVHRLGFVEQEDLVKIMNIAIVYCQPSFYEGFGLPILEAIESGIPVLSSKINVFTELFENSINYFDPHDVHDISIKIKQQFGKSENSEIFVNNAIEKIRDYSWNKTAKETVDVYKSLV